MLPLCWQMPNLTIWHFLPSYFDQYLPLQSSTLLEKSVPITFDAKRTRSKYALRYLI